jgi:photosystem II stability/assembly factor-like uncharacterized protein
MDIHTVPGQPQVLYLTTDIEGMWRSRDGGASWSSIGDLPPPISPGVLAIDEKKPLSMYYVGGVRGASMGFWVSADGGETWTMPHGFSEGANDATGGWTRDAYDVKADPVDFRHVLVTFHSGWERKDDAGVLESKDGGATWIRHPPDRGWGHGHSIWFLNDSATWLLGTQGDGYFRTENAGARWTRVSSQNMLHGGVGAFYSATGVLYVGASKQILRSTDHGRSFVPVGPVGTGYYAIIGDGRWLYAQDAFTGENAGGVDEPYITSRENDGATWTPYSGQTFADGPYRMAFDPINRILYSANWNSGVWALKVR